MAAAASAAAAAAGTTAPAAACRSQPRCGRSACRSGARCGRCWPRRRAAWRPPSRASHPPRWSGRSTGSGSRSTGMTPGSPSSPGPSTTSPRGFPRSPRRRSRSTSGRPSWTARRWRCAPTGLAAAVPGHRQPDRQPDRMSPGSGRTCRSPPSSSTFFTWTGPTSSTSPPATGTPCSRASLPADLLIPRLVTADAAAAEAFFADAVARGPRGRRGQVPVRALRRRAARQ